MEHRSKLYRCINCGHEQPITTNHEQPCVDYCHGCSRKPSFGNYRANLGGRAFRPFDFVSDDSWERIRQLQAPAVIGAALYSAFEQAEDLPAAEFKKAMHAAHAKARKNHGECLQAKRDEREPE